MEILIILVVLFVGYFVWCIFKSIFITGPKLLREAERLHKERSALSGDELRKWDENNDREIERENREVGLDINGNPLNAEIARALAAARGAKCLMEKEVAAAMLRTAIRAAKEQGDEGKKWEAALAREGEFHEKKRATQKEGDDDSKDPKKVDIKIFRRLLSVEIEGLKPEEVRAVANGVNKKMEEIERKNPHIADSSKIAILAAMEFAADFVRVKGVKDRNCPKCKTVGHDDAAFCDQCGTALPRR